MPDPNDWTLAANESVAGSKQLYAKHTFCDWAYAGRQVTNHRHITS